MYIYIYIFIYISKIKTQDDTMFYVFPQSSEVIIFYTVCYITFQEFEKVQK